MFSFSAGPRVMLREGEEVLVMRVDARSHGRRNVVSQRRRPTCPSGQPEDTVPHLGKRRGPASWSRRQSTLDAHTKGIDGVVVQPTVQEGVRKDAEERGHRALPRIERQHTELGFPGAATLQNATGLTYKRLDRPSHPSKNPGNKLRAAERSEWMNAVRKPAQAASVATASRRVALEATARLNCQLLQASPAAHLPMTLRRQNCAPPSTRPTKCVDEACRMDFEPRRSPWFSVHKRGVGPHLVTFSLHPYGLVSTELRNFSVYLILTHESQLCMFGNTAPSGIPFVMPTPY